MREASHEWESDGKARESVRESSCSRMVRTSGPNPWPQREIPGFPLILSMRSESHAKLVLFFWIWVCRILTGWRLSKRCGKVLTTQYIIHEIYGPGYGNNTQALRALMAALRRKIEKSPARPRYILTEIGVGYRLVDE